MKMLAVIFKLKSHF